MAENFLQLGCSVTISGRSRESTEQAVRNLTARYDKRPINNGDINRFLSMYDALPNIPFIMKQEVLDIITTAIEDEKLKVNKFYLAQNYPNPFNPSTVISYQLPVSSDVTLTVYDVLGNEVAILVNEEKSAGIYEVEFSASGLTSGIYFYKLTAGNLTETKKMLLMK